MKMKNIWAKATLFALLSLASGHVFSQSEKTLLDGIKLESSGGWGGTRTQLTRIAGETAWISGFHLTGEYNRKFLLGYNFNWLTDDVTYFSDQNDRSLRLRWHSLQTGYQIASHKAIHPVFDLDLGIGKAKMSDVGKDRVFVVGPSAAIELNLYRWFHLSVGGGYRWVSNVGLAGLSDKDLSGAFGHVTLKFGWSDGLDKPD